MSGIALRSAYPGTPAGYSDRLALNAADSVPSSR